MSAEPRTHEYDLGAFAFVHHVERFDGVLLRSLPRMPRALSFRSIPATRSRQKSAYRAPANAPFVFEFKARAVVDLRLLRELVADRISMLRHPPYRSDTGEQLHALHGILSYDTRDCPGYVSQGLAASHFKIPFAGLLEPPRDNSRIVTVRCGSIVTSTSFDVDMFKTGSNVRAVVRALMDNRVWLPDSQLYEVVRNDLRVMVARLGDLSTHSAQLSLDGLRQYNMLLDLLRIPPQ